MDISKSSDWVARVLVFSGRRDPEWVVPGPQVERLMAAWERLCPTDIEVKAPPQLGYRGVLLRSPDGRSWFAYGGTASLTAAGRTVARKDLGSDWEDLVIASAPAGLLPSLE